MKTTKTNITNRILAAAAAIIFSLFVGEAARAQNPGPPPNQDQVAPQVPGYGPDQADQNGQPDQGGPEAQPSADDQNAPGAARVSMIRGDVTTQRGDSGDVSTATLNTPLAPGDKVMTGNNSRAEIQLDFANVLRLGDNSSANIATLNRNQIQVQVGEGLAYFSQFKGNEANVEIDTPNVAVQPDKETSFSIFVNSGGQSEVTVRRGELTISTPQGSTRVRSGQMITVQGNGNDVQYKVSDAPSKTDWDAFNQDRDRLIEHADSWKHTDRYYTGTQDLDANGKWTEVPDYGQVWVPNQAPGWAPYSAGSWVWEPYYGWTWVSTEPWGWAPYHYGRWFVYGDGWAWWPGPIYGGFGVGFYRPIWAPAYVSFFGFGSGIGIGFGFGSFGWLPIGPCDFYHPWWGGYRGRFGAVGFGGLRDANNFRGGWGPLHGGDRFSNVRNVWTNDRVRQGLSTVSANNFGRGAVRATPASLETLRSARGMTGNLPVVPSHASLSASGNFRGAGSVTARGGTEHFFSKQTPASRPESFSQQAAHMQQAIQKDGHFSPVGGTENARNTMAGKTSSVNNSNNGEARGSGNESNRPTNREVGNGQSFGARSNGSSDRPGSPSNGQGSTQAPARNGWQRFNSSTGGNPSRPSSTGNAGSAYSNQRPGANGGFDRNSAAPQGARPQSAQPNYRPPAGYGGSSGSRPQSVYGGSGAPPRAQSVYGGSGTYRPP
ncbi:MAG: DUF6600 domain-containing protein, partial [Candidatus Acidiferrales bacterium]